MMKKFFTKESAGEPVAPPNWAAVVLAVAAALNLVVQVMESARAGAREVVVVEVQR